MSITAINISGFSDEDLARINAALSLTEDQLAIAISDGIENLDADDIILHSDGPIGNNESDDSGLTYSIPLNVDMIGQQRVELNSANISHISTRPDGSSHSIPSNNTAQELDNTSDNVSSVEPYDNFSEFVETKLFPLFENIEKKKVTDIFDLEQPVKVNIPNGKFKILVVGCGGTGSRVIPLIAQAMSNNSRIESMALVDNDKVEPANLTRQGFYEFEVGEFKSRALAERLSLLHNCNIVYSIDKFNTISLGFLSNCNDDFYSFFSRNMSMDVPYHLIVLDCTDNKEARVDIESSIVSYVKDFNRHKIFSSVTLISSGNEKDYGQIHVGHYSDNSYGLFELTCFNTRSNFNNDIDIRLNSSFNTGIDFSTPLDTLSALYRTTYFGMVDNERYNISYLPFFLEYNKTFSDGDSSESCTNMNIAEEQSIAINSTMAQLMFNTLFKIINAENAIPNAMIFANLNDDFIKKPVNTFNELLTHYSNFIFGKNTFFVQDACLDQIATAINLISNLKYDNISKPYSTYGNSDSIECYDTKNNLFIDDLIVLTVKNNMSRWNGQLEIFNSLKESYYMTLYNFITENFEGKYIDNYLNISILCYLYKLHLSSYINLMLRRAAVSGATYYLRTCFNDLINEVCTNIDNFVFEIYANIEKETDYKYIID